jgi:hypothetical protein
MIKMLIMKNSKFNGLFGAFFVIMLAVAIAGCEKDNSVVPQETSAYVVEIPADAAALLPGEQLGGYLKRLAEVDALTPEGYKMIPLILTLEVTGESFFDSDCPVGESPFAVTISGQGFSDELGYVEYFERYDTRPKNGVLAGNGRIERQVDIVQRCIPDKPTIFFQSFPQEAWQPDPVGEFQIFAPVLIKGGLVEFEGVFGEATRSITFIEGLLDHGVGLMYGYVYIPDVAAQ